MACRLDGTKPFSEPMPTYCQLDPKEHISMEFYLKFKYFHSRKCVRTCRLVKWRLPCLGLNVLSEATDEIHWGIPHTKGKQSGNTTSLMCHNVMQHCDLPQWFSTGRETHWVPDKMAAILQTTFWTIFFLYETWIEFHWNLLSLVQLTTHLYWFR